MYKVGELIHHANRGLCQVEEITSMRASASEPEKRYYKLTPLDSSGSTLFTPVDNGKVKMRRMISREEAQQLISEFPQIHTLEIADDRKVEIVCRESLASVDCKDWVSLIKTLYERRNKRLAAGKKVAASEDRYFQSATGRLHLELGKALGIETDRVEAYIEEQLR